MNYQILDGGVTPVQFKTLFTVQERVALREHRKIDPIVEEFMDIVDDPRCTTILLNAQGTKDGLLYLVSKSIITEERVPEVLAAKIV